MTVTASWGTSPQARAADRIYRLWGVGDGNSDAYDLALLHVTRPFTVNASTATYRRELTSLGLRDMVGQTIDVYGRGIHDYAQASPNGPLMVQRDGRYRAGTFTVSTVDDLLFWFTSNADGQIVAGGDSGGPSFVTSATGVPRLVGVHALYSDVSCLTNNCTDPATGQFTWDWTTAIGRCGDAPVGGQIAWAIEDVMKRPWNPRAIAATVSAADSEAAMRGGIAPHRSEQGHWAPARRTAQRVCANRGFAFGLASGHWSDGFARAPAAPDDEHQIICLSEAAGRWHGATPAQLATGGWGFADINAVGWAQAGRAANEACRAIDAGSVGGLLTGFMRTPPGAAGQRMGVFCLNASAGKWFDSTVAELARSGEQMTDLNQMDWASAARAATHACQARGYPNGGFLNGHQLGDKRGTICVGPHRPPDPPFAGGSVTPPTWIYAVATNGDLLWYENQDASRPGGSQKWLGPSKVGSGWAGFAEVFAGGAGALYALQADGTLLWYGHDGFLDGTPRWRGPNSVGSGWQTFKAVFPAANGVIYAIRPDGILLWYRHDGYRDGSFRWQGPVEIGSGWHTFDHVFAGHDGSVFAIRPDGALLRYVHTGQAAGSAAWTGPQTIGSGWAGFTEVFAAEDGVIYAVAADGRLLWYRYGQPRAAGSPALADARPANPALDNLINRAAVELTKPLSRTQLGPATAALRWEGPVEIGSGWRFEAVFPGLPAPPAPVR